MFYLSLPQSCVSLSFGEDENFNARLNHKFDFLFLKVIKNLKNYWFNMWREYIT